MSVKSKNGDNAIILGIKAGFVFLLFGLIMSASGSSVFAIDYYEITNPKFVPVNVGLITDSSSEVETVQNVFKANLEKCNNQDYFEKALELSIQNGMKVIPVDISDYLCMEIDFVDDLKQINKKI